jgi:hypothetical protein
MLSISKSKAHFSLRSSGPATRKAVAAAFAIRIMPRRHTRIFKVACKAAAVGDKINPQTRSARQEFVRGPSVVVAGRI